jgi:hypothetical protein
MNDCLCGVLDLQDFSASGSNGSAADRGQNNIKRQVSNPLLSAPMTGIWMLK